MPVELGIGDRLVGGVVVWGQVWVRQGVGGGDSLVGVENKHFLQQVDGVGLDVLEALGEGHGVSVGQGGDELEGVHRADGVDDVLRGRAQKVGDDGELVDVVLAGEERLALDHLGEDAARGPDVDLDVVLLPGEHDLGRAVVPGGHVAGHLRVLDTGEAEVADFQVTVLVDEDVAGLEVAVDDARGVHVLQASEDLVQEVLHELLFQGPRLQEAVEVRALELGDEVDVLERRKEDVLETDEVFVAQVLEQLELAVCALGEHRGGERLHDFLDGDGLARVGVGGGADEAEGAHADRVEVGVAVCDFEHGAEDLRSDELFLGCHCERRGRRGSGGQCEGALVLGRGWERASRGTYGAVGF